MKKLRLGFPKGSLQDSTIELFKKAGIRINVSSRSYFPTCSDEETFILIPAFLNNSIVDSCKLPFGKPNFNFFILTSFLFSKKQIVF